MAGARGALGKVRVRSRRGRDPAAGQALPQAGPGQFGRAVHRRVHVAARAPAEPARAACDRHIRRGRQRGGEKPSLYMLYSHSPSMS